MLEMSLLGLCLQQNLSVDQLLSVLDLKDGKQISPLACLGAGGSRKVTVERSGK